MEKELVQKAQSGDEIALEKLLGKIRPPLIRYLSRRLANLSQAEDLTQEVLVKIYGHISEAPKDDFMTWVYKIASQEGDAVVQKDEPWSPDSLLIFNQYLLDHQGKDLELFEVYKDHEESFQIRDHVEFCFSILSKSLFPQEQNIFLLREDAGLNANEIARIMGLNPEKVKVRAEESRETLSETLWERCSLVRPGAPCEQCQALGRWLVGDEGLEKQLKAMPFEKKETAKGSFTTRLEWILDLGPRESGSKFFHQKLADLLRRALGKS